MKTDGIDLYTRAGGRAGGTPIFCVPGLLAVSAAWMPAARELGREYRTVIVDNRDSGQSPRAAGPYPLEAMAGDLVRVIEDISGAEAGGGTPRKAGLLGHSMGALICLAAAALVPDMVGAVVAAAPPLRAGEYLRRTLGVYRKIAGRIPAGDFFLLALLQGTPPASFERFGPAVDAALSASGACPFSPAEEAAYGRQIDAVLGFDAAQAIGELSVPTRIISGGRDPLAPADDIEGIVRSNPAIEHVVLPGIGHVPQNETPRVFIDLAMGHFRRFLS